MGKLNIEDMSFRERDANFRIVVSPGDGHYMINIIIHSSSLSYPHHHIGTHDTLFVITYFLTLPH